MNAFSLIDSTGASLRPRAEAPFTGASRTHQDLVAWRPRRVSPVTALPQGDRDLLTDRIADQARNDGWASAGMERLVDNMIGAGWGLNVTLPRRRLGLITSPFDHEALAEALGSGDGKALDGAITGYLAGKLGYWKDAPPIHLPGAAVNFLYPGERAEHTPPTHPNAVFEHFVRAGLRHVAAALGLSYEQLSADWGQVNYSSARAALLEVWRGFSRRAALYATDFAQPVYVRWLEEAVARGRVVLPAGSPAFAEAKAAWTRCRWRMPGRGWGDPLKEAQAAAARIGLGVSTLEREAAEQGLDWEENLRQRARELAAARRLEEEYGLEAGTLTKQYSERTTVKQAEHNSEI